MRARPRRRCWRTVATLAAGSLALAVGVGLPVRERLRAKDRGRRIHRPPAARQKGFGWRTHCGGGVSGRVVGVDRRLRRRSTEARRSVVGMLLGSSFKGTVDVREERRRHAPRLFLQRNRRRQRGGFFISYIYKGKISQVSSSQEKNEQMMEYIKKLQTCIEWFTELEDGYIMEQEKMKGLLQSEQKRH